MESQFRHKIQDFSINIADHGSYYTKYGKFSVIDFNKLLFRLQFIAQFFFADSLAENNSQKYQTSGLGCRT